MQANFSFMQLMFLRDDLLWYDLSVTIFATSIFATEVLQLTRIFAIDLQYYLRLISSDKGLFWT